MLMVLQARRLSVQDDMQPVCQFFQSQGLSEQEVVEVCIDNLVLDLHHMLDCLDIVFTAFISENPNFWGSTL